MGRLRAKFESDPTFQVKFHRYMTYLWLVQLVVIPFVFFLFPGPWATASILYLVMVSLWANVATHYGAVAASEAAENSEDDDN